MVTAGRFALNSKSELRYPPLIRTHPLPVSMSPQNIFALMLDRVRAANDELAAAGMLPVGIDQSRIVVEPPREAAHGDMATNAAMVLAKDAAQQAARAGARRSPSKLRCRRSWWRKSR